MMRVFRNAAMLAVAGLITSGTASAQEIIHDAEYYVLEAQHGERWAEQDEELQEKLAELGEKHGAPPNIIHVMWDDTPVGEVGIPHLQKNRGVETPVMNEFASQGIYFTRMYTEPSCTPSRAAVLTGRHAVRNGMYNVGFPYEYGGLAATSSTRPISSPPSPAWPAPPSISPRIGSSTASTRRLCS